LYGSITQSPASSYPIARGGAGPVCKYGLHLPLNRQSDTFAREGFTLDVSTLANWVGLRVVDLALGRPREEATHIGPAGCWRTTKRPRKAAKAWCNLGGQNFETNAASLPFVRYRQQARPLAVMRSSLFAAEAAIGAALTKLYL
jgi:hypothetical protein